METQRVIHTVTGYTTAIGHQFKRKGLDVHPSSDFLLWYMASASMHGWGRGYGYISCHGYGVDGDGFGYCAQGEGFGDGSSYEYGESAPGLIYGYGVPKDATLF